MPSQDRYLEDLIDRYLAKKTKHRRLSQDNADRYRPVILRMLKPLREADLELTPTKIGEREIELLLEYYSELDTDTQKWMFSILHGWLHFYGNDVYRQMMVTWPAETRTNVDWLTPEEAVRMLDAAQGVERIVIHMELRLWLRRCEVLRLTVADIQELTDYLHQDAQVPGVVQVHGKGRGGGKWRTLAWAPDTRQEVEYYQLLRSEMIERAREHHETSWQTGKRKRPQEPFEIPEQWVIYQRGRAARGYGRTAVDNMVAAVAKRAGIGRRVGNHTLRRTGARLAYFAGVKLVEIMEALGHTSEKMTVRYLGLTVLEQSIAQAKVHDYLSAIRARMELRQGEVVVTNSETPTQEPWKWRVSR